MKAAVSSRLLNLKTANVEISSIEGSPGTCSLTCGHNMANICCCLCALASGIYGCLGLCALGSGIYGFRGVCSLGSGIYGIYLKTSVKIPHAPGLKAWRILAGVMSP